MQVLALIEDYLLTADEKIAPFQEAIENQESQQTYGRIFFGIMVGVNTAMLALVIYMMVQTVHLAGWTKLCCNKNTKEAEEEGTSGNQGEECCNGCCSATTNTSSIGNENVRNNHKCLRSSTNTIILPLFIIFLLLSWLFASLTLIAAIAGADFCIMPDAHVMSVVDSFKEDMGTEMYDYIAYYISGCDGNAPLQDLRYEFNSLVEDSELNVDYIQSNLVEDLTSTCGLQSYEIANLKDNMGLLDEVANDMALDFNAIMELVDCNKVNPIYTSLVHDAVCVNGVGGLTWVFATMLTMAIMAMLMLTFRAAIRPVKAIRKNDGFGTNKSSITDTSEIVERDVTRRVLEDGTVERIEVIKRRNADGTITEEVTTHIEEAPEVATPVETASPIAPPAAAAFANEMTRNMQTEVDFNNNMPQPIPPPSSEEDGVILEKKTTTEVTEDGTTVTTVVSLIRNPDGTVSKKTEIRNG